MSFRHFGGIKQFIDPLSLVITTPDPYSFGSVSNVAFNATADSSVVTITGLMANTNITISLSNGYYGAGTTSVAATSASFISSSGIYTTDSNGQLFVKVRGTAGASYGARTTVIVTIGTGIGYFFVYATVYDTTPDIPWGAGMTVTSAAVSTAYNTGLLTLTGMQNTYPIAISCTGGTIDAGTTALSGTPTTSKTVTTSATGTLVLTAYLNTGTAYNTENMCVITVGTVTQTFSVTTTSTVPGAPTIGTVTVSGITATVPFTAPTINGGYPITSYTATSSPGGRTGTLNQAGSGSITVSGLSASTAYTFTVTATNAVGTSSASAASNSITTAAVPGAPTGVSASISGTNSFATVSYTAPASNGGATITSYTATSLPGGLTGSVSQATSGSITVSGLTRGTTYTFTVVATNGAGSSSASTASGSVLVINYPGAPTIGTVTVSAQTATVPFTAPASNGGSAITSYTATSSPGGITGTLNQAGSGSITVSGLTGGTAYTFTVTATNAVGTSIASSASNSINPPLSAGGWAAPTTGFSLGFYEIAPASNGSFIGVGTFSSSGELTSRIYKSETGYTWSNFLEFNSTALYAIAYRASDGLYVALGIKYNSGYSTCYTISTNGTDWTTVQPFGGNTLFIARAMVVTSAGLFVAIGYGDGFTPRGITAWSTNGTTWTQTYTTQLSSGTYFDKLAMNSAGTLFVAIYYYYYIVSTDGKTWSSTNTFANGDYFNAIACRPSDGLFVVTGRLGKVSTSTNGTTWSATYQMAIVADAMIVDNSGTFIATGRSQTPYGMAYTKSTNGISWSTPVIIDPYVTEVRTMKMNSAGTIAVGGDTWYTTAVSN
jgi:hypothetical protein